MAKGLIRILGELTEKEVARFFRFLDEQRKKELTELTIDINCEGGPVRWAIGMYHYLTTCKEDKSLVVTTRNTGCVASSAIILYSSGSERLVHMGTYFVLHPVKFVALRTEQLEPETLAECQRATTADQNAMIDVIAQGLNKPVSNIAQWISARDVLTAQQAEERGLATKYLPFPPSVDLTGISITL